ncbi:hypothetical protein BH09BAC4_BH09BAC4_02020 [soil metagenome]
MEVTDLEILNASPILVDLRAILQTLDVSANIYLNRPRSHTLVDAAETVHINNLLGVQEYILPEILQLLGIRSITLSGQYDLTQLASLQIDLGINPDERNLQQYLKNDAIVGGLRALFQQSRTIAFDDWSTMPAASNVWNTLSTNVIKPIGRKDLELIFYLGDPQTKLSFQVDEALDIIGDFSRYGQITFVLDEQEALHLWRKLNGVHQDISTTDQPFPDLKRKYTSIFRTMNIGRLLIYSTSHTTLITTTKPFILTHNHTTSTIEMAADARQNFIEGFSLGLLLELDMPQCLALGLIVFGSFGEQSGIPEQKDLLAYIDHWIDELKKPETLHLY